MTGLANWRGDVGLVGGAEVVAVDVGGFELACVVGVVEHVVGFVVGEAGEVGRAEQVRVKRLPIRCAPLDDTSGSGLGTSRGGAMTASSLAMSRPMILRSARWWARTRGDDVGEEGFGEVHEAVEVHEGDLGLDHPELGEVAAGLRFFCAEGGAEAVDLAEGERGGFDVELAGLGEEGGVAEVVELEEGAGAFAGGGREDGRIGADEAVGVEVLLRGAHDGGADAEDGGLARGADPEVAMLHEEVGAVFFGRDGVGRVGRGRGGRCRGRRRRARSRRGRGGRRGPCR